MENKITYHEQNDIDNVLKLREVLKTLPPFAGIIFVLLMQPQRPRPEFPMRTISAYFFSFY